MERLTKYITPVGKCMTTLNSMKHYMPCVPCRHKAEIKTDSKGNMYTEKFSFCDTCEVKMLFNKLKEYEDAEEHGLLLRLPAPLDDVESFEIADKGIWMKIPCRKGDTVYEIDGITWKGYDWKYKSYENAFVKETLFRLEMLSEIGKTVFLTKEEAEQALAKMKEV